MITVLNCIKQLFVVILTETSWYIYDKHKYAPAYTFYELLALFILQLSTSKDSPNAGWVTLTSLVLNSIYKSTTELVSSLIITLIIISATDTNGSF